MNNPYQNVYPFIRDLPREAWKKKAWPITEQEIIKPTLEGNQAELFEKKRQAVRRMQ